MVHPLSGCLKHGELVFQLGDWARNLQLLRVKRHVSKPEEQKVKARYRAVAPEEKKEEEEEWVVNVSV